MTLGVTKEWLAQKAANAQAPVTEGWRAGALTIFVPGKPTHFKGKGHRYTVARHTKDWRERTATRIYLAGVSQGYRGETPRLPWPAETPKTIAFTVYSRNAFDDDNLKLVCSGARDGLKDMRVIQDDRSSAGHTFVYTQAKPTRSAGAIHGISIRIELASPGSGLTP